MTLWGFILDRSYWDHFCNACECLDPNAQNGATTVAPCKDLKRQRGATESRKGEDVLENGPRRIARRHAAIVDTFGCLQLETYSFTKGLCQMFLFGEGGLGK